MARLARERIDRETAAAQLRDLRNLAAALGLLGGEKGEAEFEKFEREIESRANA